MTGIAKTATDRALRAWLSAGPIDRGVGDGLIFVATEASAVAGKASWILRYRFGGRCKEKVIGPYPDISLKEARELARNDRAKIQQGVDVASEKRRAKREAVGRHDVTGLGKMWMERHILPSYKYPGCRTRAQAAHQSRDRQTPRRRDKANPH
jgi:hypothetical protein